MIDSMVPAPGGSALSTGQRLTLCPMRDGLEEKIAMKTLNDLSLEVQTWQQGSAAVVGVSGEVDTTTAPVMREAVDAAIDSGTSLVVVDLTAVGFIDSAGLAALVQCLKRAAVHEVTLRLVVNDSYLLRVLSITGLHNVFNIYHDTNAAAGSVK